ncbi:MobH family relaxase [Vibrio sp. TBV020]|uniref:MobH family relaxase n=1 Tax=Vibrio sp. TBV020 TaxID=3137398 RepID=UPI0038CDAE1A
MFKKLKHFIEWLNTNEQPNNVVTSSDSDAATAPEGFVFPRNRHDIEHDEIIQDKLRVLKRSGLALPYEVWPEFVVDTVVNFALWCQDLPASEHYHHTGKQGLLLHSLDVAIYAMRLRRNYILPPNTAPEEVIHREIVWVYGVFLCALLHDAGKVLDMEVELYQKGKEPRRWTPALGPIIQPYRCRYYKDRQYTTHKHNGLLLLNQLLSADPMAAITHDRPLYHAMTEYLSGHDNPDNVIGQIITQADAASVAQDLGADKAGIDLAAEKARGAAVSLAGQLRLSLVHLLESGQIPLNKKGAEGFVEGESLYLVCKPIAERLRSALIERGITSAPSDNSRLFNELQQHQLIRPNHDDMAVWKCEVHLSEFDWTQTFTFVCVHWPSLLPDAELDTIVGSVTPEQPDKTSGEANDALPQAMNVSDNNLAQEIKAVDEPASMSESTSSLPQAQEVTDDLMQFFTQVSPAAGNQEEVEPVTPSTSQDVTSDMDTIGQNDVTPSEPTPEESVETPNQGDDDLDDKHILLRKVDLREMDEEALGDAFYQWLNAVLLGGVHPVNRKGALFHRLEQGLFVVSPGAFRLFVDERCQYAQTNSYIMVQKAVQSLGVHLPTAQGRNVHKGLIQDSEATLNGFLFSALPEWQERYAMNPHVSLEEA